MSACTCGNAQPHRVAWRRTAGGGWEPTGHTLTSARDLARHLLAVQTGARS